jgi:TRAP-type C4-dicarboxylate transport system substrate-binding protein
MRGLLVTTALAGLVATGAAQAQTELRMLMSFDERFAGWQLWAERYAEMVEEASGGDIVISLNGPDVVPSFEQFEPVSQGVFDININIPPYFIGTTSVPNLLYALPPDMDRLRETGIWDMIDASFREHNQTLIAGFFSDPGCFHIMLREPLDEGEQPLSGRVIRANRTYAPAIEPLGGSISTMPMGEIYAALERGVVDGAGWTVVGTMDLNLHEVTDYMMRPTFGWCGATMAFNLDSWAGLSEDEQALLLEQARILEVEGIEAYNALTEEEDQALRDAGVQETVLDPAIYEQIQAEYENNMWAVSASYENSQEAVEAIREVAREHGMAQ